MTDLIVQNAEDDIHKPFSIKMDDYLRQDKLMKFLRLQFKIHNFGKAGPCPTGPGLGGPDLTFLIQNDRFYIHSLLLWFHACDFSKWLSMHQCTSLPATIDLRKTELTVQAMRNVADWVYEMDDDTISLDLQSAIETMYAAAYFGINALLKIVQDYSLQVSLQKPMVLLKWLAVSERLDCDPLYKNELYHLAATYFQAFLKTDPAEIGRLPVAAMINLLHREDLNVQTEIDPFKLALTWIRVNKSVPERRSEASEVLEAVRFVTMPAQDRQLCWQLAQDDHEILELLKQHVVPTDLHKTCEENQRDKDKTSKEVKKPSKNLPSYQAWSTSLSGSDYSTRSRVDLTRLSDAATSMQQAETETQSLREVMLNQHPLEIEQTKAVPSQSDAKIEKIETAPRSHGGPGSRRGLSSLQDASELRKRREQSLEDINRARKSPEPDNSPKIVMSRREIVLLAEDYRKRSKSDEQPIDKDSNVATIANVGNRPITTSSKMSEAPVSEQVTAQFPSTTSSSTTTEVQKWSTISDNQMKDQPRSPSSNPKHSQEKPVKTDDQTSDDFLSCRSSITDPRQQQIQRRTSMNNLDCGRPLCFHFETSQAKATNDGTMSSISCNYDFKNEDKSDCKHELKWKAPYSRRG